MRVVSDASAKSSAGVSLNDTLLPGPSLYPPLTTLLLKFRTYNIAVSADIAKMFREISVHPEDRDLLRLATDVNPANAASRGVFPEELVSKKLWWEGPQWLTSPPTEWRVRLDIGDPPVKEQANFPVPVPHVQPIDEPPELLMFSSLYKLIRFWTYARRWILAVRAKQSPNSFLTNKELQAAEQSLIIASQRKFYPQEYSQLQNGQHVSSKSSLSKLSPYMDKQGVIWVGGRLHNANLAEATKNQIILHQKSQIVVLLLNDLHRRHFHANARVMLAIVAERFYISGLRSLACKVVHECVSCRCIDAPLCTQQMGVLPADRVRPASPFLNIGLDFAGPIMVKRGYTRKPVYEKAYVCVCLFALSLKQFIWNL